MQLPQGPHRETTDL